MTNMLTADEVAEAWRVSPRSVRAWARLGILPAIQLRPRGRLLFPADAVNARLDQSRLDRAPEVVEPEPEPVGAEVP